MNFVDQVWLLLLLVVAIAAGNMLGDLTLAHIVSWRMKKTRDAALEKVKEFEAQMHDGEMTDLIGQLEDAGIIPPSHKEDEDGPSEDPSLD